MLIASLLFYQKFKKDIEAIGFKVNPYYPCAANKMLHDKQMKITWHVNDHKVSHVEKDIIDTFIKCTNETYEYIPIPQGIKSKRL